MRKQRPCGVTPGMPVQMERRQGGAMSNTTKQQADLFFVIGRPGAGKTTFARYLALALHDQHVLSVNDYDLLLEMAHSLPQDQIRWDKEGHLEVVNRAVFDALFDTLTKIALANRGKRPTIVELSRAAYVETLRRSPELQARPPLIIYLNAPLETCIRRNAGRDPGNAAKIVPEGVIRKYYAEDDIGALAAAFPERVRIVDNAGSSLSTLEREAALLVADLFGGDPQGRTASRWKEILTACMLIGYLVAFLVLGFAAWQAKTASLIFRFISPDPESIPLMKMMGIIASAGGLGSATYCIRAFYSYYIQGTFDFDRFKWWYVFRPITGALLALSVYALVQGGVSAIGGSAEGQRGTMTWFGLSYLAGFATEQVVEWLRRTSKSIFGESRVQPDHTSQTS
jgi:adenylate kinase family enzyme